MEGLSVCLFSLCVFPHPIKALFYRLILSIPIVVGEFPPPFLPATLKDFLPFNYLLGKENQPDQDPDMVTATQLILSVTLGGGKRWLAMEL